MHFFVIFRVKVWKSCENHVNFISFWYVFIALSVCDVLVVYAMKILKIAKNP